MSDPDGHQADGGAALTRDSYVTSSGNGGALSIGGDFVNTSKSPSLWNMTDVAVKLDGSSAQRFEVASEDRGASAGGGNGNYGIGSLTVAAGADVTLVDDYDNSRDTATAEAVYVEDLIVESGATLRLNGHNVYVTGSQSVEGTVVEDGGAITFMRTTKTVVVPLGPVDNSAGLGHWVGGIAIGDINGDGNLNNRDVTRLMQYLAGWDVEITSDFPDLNGDGSVNNKDVTRLMRYLAGWDIEIY
jgi:hypothetical protein